MAETRKIAAILAADVVGFSRMASANEDRTLARLRTLRSELIDPTVGSQNGRVFKRTGDGALVEFRSVVEAVRCAISVQNAMIERNAGVPTDQRIDFRIGIHLGDIVEESDGDLMGDGVNIAARLEGIAEPGAICLSEDAYRQVKGRLDLAVTDLGLIRLKNIAEPVRAYSLQVGVPAAAKLAPAAMPESEAKSVSKVQPPEPKRRSMLAALVVGIAAFVVLAGGTWYFLAGGRSASVVATNAPAAHLSIVVLPFANLSNDPSQDYFADGITENLTTDLSRIRDSFVIARNTAFTYKGKAIDAKEIGKELGVRYVLEGSVQRDQNHVRINAQLIDAASGAHLWADRFEEDVADLFKLQDEVVARLADSLGWALTKAEAEKGARSKNPDAIDLTMRGWYLVNSSFSQGPDMLHQARALFERALQIDPEEVDALDGTAVTYFFDFINGWGDPGTDYDAKVLGQANRAITLDPDNRRAYWAKADYLVLSRRPGEALGAADAGLAINQNIPALYQARALAENSLGRYEQGKADAERAIRLSPRDPAMGFWHIALGDSELGLNHFDVAIGEFQKVIDAGAHYYIPYVNLAAAYALAGKMDEAKNALAEGRRLNPNLTVKWLTDHAPNIPPLFDGLRKAGLPEE